MRAWVGRQFRKTGLEKMGTLLLEFNCPAEIDVGCVYRGTDEEQVHL